MSADSNSRILFISLRAQPWFNWKYATLMNRILQVASLEQAHRPIPAMRAIAENPKAIFITDEAIANLGYSAVWAAVIRYIRNGGTAICMGHFSCKLPAETFKMFFSSAGLAWDYGSYERCQSFLNTDFLPREITDILPAAHSAQAVHLKDVGDASWYRPEKDISEKKEVDEDSDMSDEQTVQHDIKSSTPVAMAQVGNGYLGFVGDVNSSEESNLVMIAMCGLYV